jgi:hypothetical protein
MDIAAIVGGILLCLWPVQFYRSNAKIRKRFVDRYGNSDRFDRRMAAPWIRVSLIAMPMLGMIAIAVGIAAR